MAIGSGPVLVHLHPLALGINLCIADATRLQVLAQLFCGYRHQGFGRAGIAQGIPEFDPERLPFLLERRLL